MPEPSLVREVEYPRERRAGVAVVLVAALAMFTAVLASALVVHSRSTCLGRIRTPVDVEPAQASFIQPINVLDDDTLSEEERHLGAIITSAAEAGHDEEALTVFGLLPPRSLARVRLATQHHVVAERFLEAQLVTLAKETRHHYCAAMAERLARLQRLLPERHIPAQMAACEPKRGAHAAARPSDDVSAPVF
jgi:hypothetical protein